MKFSPLPIIGGSYADDSLSWTAQDTVNWLPSQAEAEGTKTPSMLKTPPGLKPFAEVPPTGGGEDPLIPSPPVRGSWNAEGKAFHVIGTELYHLSNAGVFIPLGTVPGTGRVTFAHNQISLGNQVVAMNGSAGYVYNTRTQVFERITDPGFSGGYGPVFIDGYILSIAANRRFVETSDVANALEYNTLDRFTSEFSPDLLVALAASNNELFVLSETSGEFFENTGAAQQPFRSKRITMDRGCAGAYTVAKADNTVFWLGNNGYFYVLNGYAPQRISTRAIEQSILGKNWKNCFAFAWEDAGHTVIYWTFPDGLTWGYDTSTGLWHRRASYGLNRWRANTMTFWNQKWYVGDFQTGRVWEMDWDYILEGDQEFISERTTSVIHNNQNRIIIPRLELLMQVGQEETIPTDFPVQPVGPTITGDSPNGEVGEVYSFAYTVTPGDAPIAGVVLRSGSLPPGLSLSSAGVLTGTPTAVGLYEYSLRVTDTNLLYDDLDDSIAVNSVTMAIRFAPGDAPRFLFSTDGGYTWPDDWEDSTDGRTAELFATADRFISYGALGTPAYLEPGDTVWTVSTGVSLNGGGHGPAAMDSTGLKVMIPSFTEGPAISLDNGSSFALTGSPRTGEFMCRIEDIWIINDSGNLYSSDDDGVVFTSLLPSALYMGLGGARWSGSGRVMFGGSTASVGSLPKIVQSVDGVTFTTVTLPTFGGGATYITALCSGILPEETEETWVCAANNGEIAYRNPDTGVWALAANTMECVPLSISFNGTAFVGIGGVGSDNDFGFIKTSVDANIWTTRKTAAIASTEQWRHVASMAVINE